MKTWYSIAAEFGKTPSARKEEEGKLSGIELRNNLKVLIRQNIESNELISIDMDGTAGYGSSFLEEVFGGLVRVEGFTLAELERHMVIKTTEDPDLEDEIWEDIRDAEEEKHGLV